MAPIALHHAPLFDELCTMVKPCISLKTKSQEQFGPHLVNFRNYFVDEKSFIRTRERLFISRFEYVECGNVVKY